MTRRLVGALVGAAFVIGIRAGATGPEGSK